MTTRSSASRNAFIAFATVAAIVAGAAIFLGWHSAALNRQLFHRGTATFGEVTGRERAGAMRGSDDFVVRYAYSEPNGRLHAATMSVSHEAWDGWDAGMRVPVTYLPDDPSIHVPRHITEAELRRPLRVAVGFAAGTVGLTLLVGGLAFLVSDSRGRRRSKPVA